MSALTPIFAVHDIAEASEFYEGLGLEVVKFDDTYVFVIYREQELLHLREVTQHDPSANHASAYWHVEDADAVHRELPNLSGSISSIDDQPWGMREFSVTDPSGNVIRVGHQISSG